eukprot:366228-Chlamydomonas_euryale.AAC.19
MVNPAWGALAVPMLVAGGMVRGRRKGGEDVSDVRALSQLVSRTGRLDGAALCVRARVYF